RSLRDRSVPCGGARSRLAGRKWRGRRARGRSPASVLRSDGACQTSRVSASRAGTPVRGELPRTDRELGPLPLGRRGRLALVLALEALHPAGGVHELLLARIERVAL